MNIGSETVKRYADIIKAHPILSIKEETKLFKLLFKYKDGKQKQEYRDRLFNSNVSLVMKYAYYYSKRSCVSVEDLISAGNEGLGIAIDRFDPKRGCKFSTYAVPWIKLHIFKTLTLMGRIVSIPSHIIEKIRKYNEIINKNRTCKASEEEIKEQMEITEKVLFNIKAAQIKTISMDQTYGNGEDGQETISNIIPDTKTVSCSKALMDEDRKRIIEEVLSELTPIQKEVVVARYLDDDKNKLSEVGIKYSITGERVRQIEVKALRRIRFKMRQRGFLKKMD